MATEAVIPEESKEPEDDRRRMEHVDYRQGQPLLRDHMEANTSKYFYKPGGSSRATVKKITTKSFRSQLLGITDRRADATGLLSRLQKQLRTCNPVEIGEVEKLVMDAKKDHAPEAGAEGAYGPGLLNYVTSPASEWNAQSMEDLAQSMFKDSQYQLARYSFETSVKQVMRALLALPGVNPHKHRKYRNLMAIIDLGVPIDHDVGAHKIDLGRPRHHFDLNQIIFHIVIDRAELVVDPRLDHYRMPDLGEQLEHDEVLCVADTETKVLQDVELYGQRALWDGDRYKKLPIDPRPAVGSHGWIENLLANLQQHWIWRHWEDMDKVEWLRYSSLLGRWAQAYFYLETIYLFEKIDLHVKNRAVEKWNRGKPGNPASIHNIARLLTIQDYLNDPNNSTLDSRFSCMLSVVHRAILHVCYRWRYEAGCRQCGTILDFTCISPDQMHREVGSHCCASYERPHYNERVLSIQTPYVSAQDDVPNTWRKYICTQCGYLTTGQRHDIIHHMLSHHNLPEEYKLCGYSREGISNLASRFNFQRNSLHAGESVWVGTANTLASSVTVLGKINMEELRLCKEIPLWFAGHLNEYGRAYRHVLRAPKRQLLCRM